MLTAVPGNQGHARPQANREKRHPAFDRQGLRRAVIFQAPLFLMMMVDKMYLRTNPPLPNRRLVLTALAGLTGLTGCTTPLPLGAGQRPSTRDAKAAARLMQSAQAHGLAAYQNISDINIAYDGQWRPFINGIQPEVVDAGFRGSSQERLVPALGINAQHYTGPAGRKFVAWQPGAGAAASSSAAPSNQPGQIAIWYNGQASADKARLAAAALVADIYGLFLLGPLWVVTQQSRRELTFQMGGTERVDGRLCDVLQIWMKPGYGLSGGDRLDLCIDSSDHITRRVRFSLEGFAGTQGAVAETDTYDHAMKFGVLWPMRSFERIVHPLGLPAHDWHITGLDVNRGYGAQALLGPEFTGAAAAPAAPILATNVATNPATNPATNARL
jgi:hypothetical protein